MSEGTVPLIWYVAPHIINTTGNEEILAAARKYGDPSIICSRLEDRLALPSKIARTLASSKDSDSLLLCGDQYVDLLCVAIWFMYHKDLTVLLHEHYQYCAYTVNKESLMSLVQREHDRRKA